MPESVGVASTAAKEYLCVDQFLSDVIGAGALQSALELGVIDSLLQKGVVNTLQLAAQAKLDQDAAGMLVGLLRSNAVIEECPGGIRLSTEFLKACRYRELMEAKLEFAALLAPDFLQRFTTLLADPAGFYEQALLFKLFSYDRCFEATAENFATTRRWMRFTTALTHCESQVCLEMHDFSASRRMLDVGGNSGEFALQLCKCLPELTATILDLPIVCDIGAAYVANEPEASRISFHKTDGTDPAFPKGFDIVCFKSMLHDWPDEQAANFLRLAYDALEPGGTLLIFERGKIEIGSTPMPYSLIPILLFFRSYRMPQDYVRELERIGFRDLHWEMVTLDVPFMVVRARK